MRLRIDRFLQISILVSCVCLASGAGKGTDVISLELGAATRLKTPAGEDAVGNFTSTDPHAVQVFRNGYIIGLRTGSAQIRAGGQQWIVDVTPPQPQRLVDPKTLRQHDDNRRFDVDGRRCYGS